MEERPTVKPSLGILARAHRGTWPFLHPGNSGSANCGEPDLISVKTKSAKVRLSPLEY